MIQVTDCNTIPDEEDSSPIIYFMSKIIKRAADTKQNSKNKSNIDEEYEWMIQVADRYTIPDEGIK